MATELTKTQVDRLGDRLRKGAITEADLRLLDHYRRSFAEAYDAVVEAVKNDLGLEPKRVGSKLMMIVSWPKLGRI